MNFLVGQLLGFTDGAHSMESMIWNLFHLLQTAKFDLNFDFNMSMVFASGLFCHSFINHTAVSD